MAKRVSIIVLCHNRWADSRRCLESLKASTPRDLYEVLAYDNASSDATLSNLKRMARGWPQLRVFANERNLSFSEGVNRGMRAAKGRHFLWLNNDTVLAPGWLEGLLAAVRPDGIGAAGPMTDHKAPPRQVSAPFITRTSGKTLDAPFLGGFCFLLKRSAVERAGFLDERFVWGWEDMDYCMRLRQSGLRLLLARDVFVRHAGSRTLQDMASSERQRTDIGNRRLMIQKWMREDPWKKDLHELYRELPAPWHTLTPKTSLLLVCRGGARDRLESARRNLQTRDYEVLAVNAGGRGWAAALNRAAAQAQGNYFAVLPGEALVEPKRLGRLIKMLEARPDAGAVKAEPELIISRKAFERAGGFDERFSGSLCAADYCLRLIQAGFSVLEDGQRPQRPRPALSSDLKLATDKWLHSNFDRPDLIDKFWKEIGSTPALALPAVSIVVICRGKWEKSRRCLSALRLAAGKSGYEVLTGCFRAQAKTSAKLKKMEKAWPQMKFLGKWEPTPYAHVLNLAQASARGEFILFLSDDVLPSPGCVEALVAAAKKHASGGVVAPRCVNTQLNWQRNSGPKTARSVDYVRDYGLLIPKAVFSSLGGFDNRFEKTMWAEDFCFRAKQKGYEVLVAGKALVRASGKENLSSSAHDTSLIFGKWSGHPLFQWR